MEPSTFLSVLAAVLVLFILLCLFFLGLSFLAILLCAGGLTALMCALAYSFFWTVQDRRGQPRQRGTATIVGVHHEPSKLEYLYGSNSMMFPVYSNPTWSVCVRRDGQDTWIDVKPSAFERLRRSSQVEVDYVIGRSGKLYVDEVYH